MRSKYRVKSYGCKYTEKVDPIKVLERDNWICQLCGKKLKPEDRGKFNYPDAPEIDHIVPLCIGGEHSYKNVRALCHSCNIKEINRIRKQYPEIYKRLHRDRLIESDYSYEKWQRLKKEYDEHSNMYPKPDDEELILWLESNAM